MRASYLAWRPDQVFVDGEEEEECDDGGDVDGRVASSSGGSHVDSCCDLSDLSYHAEMWDVVVMEGRGPAGGHLTRSTDDSSGF